MGRRKRTEQTAHDRKVERLAREYKRKGWKVKADIPGYEKPPSIGKYGHIPDLEVTKRGKTKIIEVETPSTLNSDKKQRETFKKSASHRRRTVFEMVIVRPRKKAKKR